MAQGETPILMTTFELPDDDAETWQTRIDLAGWNMLGKAVDHAPHPEIILAFDAKGENPPALTDDELAQARWFLDHHHEVLEAALKGLFEAYPGLIKFYGYDDDERSRWMPEIGSIKDLMPLVRPTYVTIHEAASDAWPLIGILFDCTWDHEHGTGALLHGVKLIAAGDADYDLDGNQTA